MSYKQFIIEVDDKGVVLNEYQIPIIISDGTFYECGIKCLEEDSMYNDENNPDTGYHGQEVNIWEFSNAFNQYFRDTLREVCDNHKKFEKVDYFEYVFFGAENCLGESTNMFYNAPTHDFISCSAMFIRDMRKCAIESKYKIKAHKFYFDHG